MASGRAVRDSPVVIDASIAVQWFANETGSDRAEQLLDSDHVLIAPDLMAVEAANALWKKARRREIDAADVALALEHLRAVGIEWIPVLTIVHRAAVLAIKHSYPVYDCLYVAVAATRHATIATSDERLAALARSLRIRLQH